MIRIFISYSRVDRPFVDELIPRIRRVYRDFSFWFDDELRGGDEWWNEILRQIAACDIFIYLLSNESIQSEYCQREYDEARRLQKQVLPVQVRARTTIPNELSGIQYVDMSKGWKDADALNDLHAALHYLAASIPKNPLPPLSPQPIPKPNVRPKQRHKLPESWAIIIAAFVTGIFVIIAALITAGNSPNNNSNKTIVTQAVSSGVSDTPSFAPTHTVEPSVTPTVTVVSETPEPTAIPTVTVEPSETSEPTETLQPTSTSTYTPTKTSTPTTTPTLTFTNSPTSIPTPSLTFTMTRTATIVSQTTMTLVSGTYPCRGTIISSGSDPLLIIYARPISRFSPIASILPETEVLVLDNTLESGRKWYEIQYGDDQRTGWVWDNYLSLSSECP